jgi:hypothetical protein
VQPFTPNQPIVNSIRQEDTHSDSTTNYYGGLTPSNYILFPHANIPPTTTSTNWYSSQEKEAPSSHVGLACARNAASPVSHTGGGALAHARAVAVTPLLGVQPFTPNQPIVNLIRQEDPHSDSNTTYYSELRFPTSVHTPSPSSLTYVQSETITTQRLQRRLHSTLPRHERARRDCLLAETSRLPPTIFQVDHVMDGPR